MVGSRFGRARPIFARFEVSQNPGSRATLNVMGGKLTIQDGVIRNNVTAATIPTINLTGGELELTPAGRSYLLASGYEPHGHGF